MHSCFMFLLYLAPALWTNQVVPPCQIIARKKEKEIGRVCGWDPQYVSIKQEPCSEGASDDATPTM